MNRGLAAIAALLAAVVLSACGGGGGSSPGGGGPTVIANRPPTAVAGAAQNVTTGAVVTFSGSGSSDPDGNTITYAWQLTSRPAGSVATLTGATTVSPTLRADRDGTYGVSLVVSDGSLSSAASTTTATAIANAADQTAAANARATATIDIPSAAITLQWQDSFPAGTSYRVETQQPDASFTTVETLVGGAGPVTWGRTYSGAVVYRIVAVTSGREVPVLTSTGGTLLDATAVGQPAIVVTTSEPVAATTNLILAPATGGSTLSWTADGLVIGTGNNITWNTASLPDTSHIVAVRADLNTGVFVDTRRTVVTANTTLNVAANYQQLSSASFVVDVTASSPLGVASVEARMDGGAPQTLTARNACSLSCIGGTGFTLYRFTYNPTTLGSGAHTATIRVTDTGGGVKQITLAVQVSNAPGLTVSSPSSGAFVFGTLTLAGTTTTDTGQPVSVTGFLGGGPFLTSTAASFSGSTALAGRPVGTTLLVTRATDANNKTTQDSRNVVIASSAALALTPLFSVGETDTILAAEGDLVLFRAADLSLAVRNVTAGANVSLAPVNGVTGRLWLTTDFVYGLGAGSDAGCKAGDTCIYRWSTTTGAVTNVSASDTTVPSAVINQRSAPVVRGRYAVWRNQLANGAPITYTLYDGQTSSFTSVPTVTGLNATSEFDLAVVGGVPTLFYAATRPSSGSSASDQIAKWTPAGGSSAFFTAASNQSMLDVQTDGVSVLYTAASGVFPALFMLPVGGGTPTPLDSTINSVFVLRDGAARWLSGISRFTPMAWSPARGAQGLNGAAVTPGVQAVGSGFVAFDGTIDPGMRTWSGATGTIALKADGGPYIPFITGNWLYFKSGTGIYRVALS
jgi:hypothetical protein